MTVGSLVSQDDNVSPDQAAHLDFKPFIIVVLILTWTAMAVLGRGHTKASPRVQRIALTFTASVSAALLGWIVWSQPQPQPSDLGQVWAGARALLADQPHWCGEGLRLVRLYTEIYRYL